MIFGLENLGTTYGDLEFLVIPYILLSLNTKIFILFKALSNSVFFFQNKNHITYLNMYM